MPKGILFKILKNKFNKKAGFECTNVEVRINYLKNQFEVDLINETQSKSDGDKVTNYSDLSEMLLNKINKQLNCDKIDIIILKLDLKNKNSTADVYFSLKGENNHVQLKEMF